MLTLKAAGLVDIDAGEIVRPGILRIDGDRIAAVGGPVAPSDEVVDLGSLILSPAGRRGPAAALAALAAGARGGAAGGRVVAGRDRSGDARAGPVARA